MGADFLFEPSGRGGTVGSSYITLGSLVAGAGTGVVVHEAVLPSAMPGKEIYDEHHDNVMVLQAANRDLEQVRKSSSATGDEVAAMTAERSIIQNNQKISIETSQYPASYNPVAAEYATYGSGLLTTVLVYAALTKSYRKAARRR